MALLKDPAIKFGILGGLANLVTFFILYSLGAEIFIGIWRYLPWFGMFTLAFIACVQIIRAEGYLLFPRAMSIILVVIVISEFTAVVTEFVIRNVVDPGLTEQIREIRLINTEEAAEWFDENLGYSEGDMQEVMEQVENADFNFYLKDALLKFLQILCIDFIFALILAAIVKKQPNPTQMSAVNISIVVPLFNEEESLPELSEWIDRVMQENGFTYEIIMIDDGSTDSSWKIVGQLREKNPNIRGISFRRNYGKSAALHEGFKATRGTVVITMDADLQDSPDEIPELYRMIVEDKNDLVSGWKRKRYDPITKTIPTKLYNGVTRWVSGIKLNDFNCGLKSYRSDVVKSIEVYGEMHRYIPVIAKWAGFKKIAEKEVQHRARKYGTTKFGLERFVNGFLDLMSITFVSRYGKKPMHFFGLLGSLFFLLGSMIALWIIGEKIVYAWVLNEQLSREVTDQPLFYVSLVTAIIGAQMFLAGFIGELMSRNSPIRNHYHKKDLLGIEDQLNLSALIGMIRVTKADGMYMAKEQTNKVPKSIRPKQPQAYTTGT